MATTKKGTTRKATRNKPVALKPKRRMSEAEKKRKAKALLAAIRERKRL